MRLSVLATELEAAGKELDEGRRALQADVDVALATRDANERLRAELAAREAALDGHEAALKEWRGAIKAEVGEQVAAQEAALQVRPETPGRDMTCSLISNAAGQSEMRCARKAAACLYGRI